MHVVTPSLFCEKRANIFCKTSRGQNTSIREQKVKKRAFSVVKLTVWLTIHSPWLKAFVHAFSFNGQKLLWRFLFTPSKFWKTKKILISEIILKIWVDGVYDEILWRDDRGRRCPEKRSEWAIIHQFTAHPSGKLWN